ncbi:MAG: alpha/beta hydrolase [Candidatus Rokubacteria bacterium]|nr:alpha/beta hydrolase [Candidatus Rokubacteria bacterium]
MPTVASHDGIPLYYELHDYTDPWKNAPTLILQHGFGRSGRFWYNMIPYLARFYKVLCPTLRGLGEHYDMKDPEARITAENYIRDLVTILDYLGLDRVHYAGESLGGIIGMYFAGMHPERVRTLSLFAAPLIISAETRKTFTVGYPTWQDALQALGVRGWSNAVNTVTRFPPGTHPGMLEWFSNEMSKSRLEVVLQMSRLAAQVNPTPVLGNIQAPVLGLYPSQGGALTSNEQFDILKRNIKNLRLIHLDTQYHMVHALEPANCARHVLYFCSEYDGTPCRER